MVVNLDSQEQQSNELIPAQTGYRKWWTMLGIGIGTFLLGLDMYIVNLVLPTLVESLHTTFAAIQWVLIAYSLMLTVFALSAASLGDIYSKKWLYQGGLILFSISSLLCGLAPTVGFLISFRVLQGLSAVFMSVLGMAIITQVFPATERGRALGILNGILVVGVATGPAVGGLLLGLGDWRLIFLVNVPIGLIASIITAFAVPSSESKDAADNIFRFDVMGTLLMTVTLTCFALAMTQVENSGTGSLTQLILLAVAAIGLVCFLMFEARVESPLLDLRVFRSLELSLSLLLNWVVFFVIGGIDLLIPFFLELIKLYPPQQAGILLMAMLLFSAMVSLIAGTLSDRLSEGSVSLIGLLLMVVGCWTCSTLDTSSTMLDFLAKTLLIQLGIGTFCSSNNSAVMGSIPQERLAMASGLLSFSRTMGLSMGVSLLGTLFSTLTLANAVETLPETSGQINVTNAPTEALVFGLNATFAITALILSAAIILVAFLRWRSSFGYSPSLDLVEQKQLAAPTESLDTVGSDGDP